MAESFDGTGPGIESGVNPERESRFQRVVFGHRFQDFDRDQFVTYILARQLGVITPDTPVAFTDTVSSADIIDPQVLVIEGVPEQVSADGRNQPVSMGMQSGNFDNDTNSGRDIPATSVFYTADTRGYPKEFSSIANQLSRFMTAAESDNLETIGQDKIPKEFVSQLKTFSTSIFHGVKSEYRDNPDEFLPRITNMFMQFLMASAAERSQLITGWNTFAKTGYEYLQQQEAVLHRAIDQVDRFEHAITGQGISMAYFDTRGTGTNAKAAKIVRNYLADKGIAEPELLVIIGDQYDSSGNLVPNSSKIMVRTRKKDNNLNIKETLQERWQYTESLFGNGYRALVGGHPGIQVSDRATGSGLRPRQMWYALQRFFSTETFSQAQFAVQAHEFAVMAGVETVAVGSNLESDTPGRIPERYFTIVVPKENETGQLTQLDVHESELPLYREVFTSVCNSNPEQFRRLLSQQNSYELPIEIAELKSARAHQYMREQLDAGPLVLALDALADMNPASIARLPVDTMVKLVDRVAADPEAIDAIYNPSNTTYRITAKSAPNYISAGAEGSLRHRFSYDSLSKSFDIHVVHTVLMSIARAASDPEIIRRIVAPLEQIVLSDEYKKLHTDAMGDDKLLYSVVDMYTIPTVVQQPETVSRLHMLFDAYSYLKDTIQKINNGRRTRLAAAIPDLIQIPDTQTPYILGLESNPDAEVVLPDYDMLESIVAEQRKIGADPIATVVLQLGRPLDADAYTKGIHRRGGTIDTVSGEPVARVIIPKSIELNTSDREIIEIVRILDRLARDINQYTSTEVTACPVRIVMSGVPNQLSVLFGVWYTQHNLAGKVEFCNYDMQRREYHDWVPQSLPF